MAKKSLIIITDLHLHKSNLEVVKSIFEQAKDKALEFGFNTVYCGGDIFDSRKSQSETVLNTFMDILDDYNDSGVKLVAIAGNHDKTDYGSYSSYLRVYKHHPAFHWVEEIEVVEFKKFNLVLFPYLRENIYREEFKKKIDKSVFSKDSVLLTHVAINGVLNNDKSIVESGVPASFFGKFKVVLVGHYHDSSFLGKNIHYIGASRQMNFGENPDKGCIVLNEDLSYDRINLSFPKYITISVDLDNGDDINKAYKEGLRIVKRGDHVRVNVSGSKGKIDSLNRHKFISSGIKLNVLKGSDAVDLSYTEDINYSRFDKGEIKDEFNNFMEKQDKDIKQGIKYLNKVL